MADLSSIASATTAATALSNLILVSPNSNVGYQPQPQSQGAQNPPSILFHYEGEQTTTIQSDITDHYIEDNTAIQDQIALKPLEITTHGFIGELNNVTPPVLAPLQTAANKLTIVSAYVPVLSATAIIAYDEAFAAYQLASNAANSSVSAWSSIAGNNSTNQTKQQVYFQQFYGYWSSRTLFTVQTPWGVFKDMAIKSLRAIQDSETRMITDFEVSFKMIRTASTATTPGLASVQQGRAAIQSASPVQQGSVTPQPASTTLGSQLSNTTGG